VGQQYEHQQQHKPQLDLLSILLAPAAPLLAPRHARKAAAADSGEGSLSSGSAGSASHAVSNGAAVEASHSMGGSSESGGAGHLEDLLLRLQAAAAAPHVHSDPQFDAVRALLAAAPAAGEPRRNFALSLVRQLQYGGQLLLQQFAHQPNSLCAAQGTVLLAQLPCL
jgi:hypothetical protein